MHTYCNFNTMYNDICKELYNNGEIISARELETKEINNCQLILTNPRRRILSLSGRALDYKYLAGEICFYLSGSNKLDFINKYSTFWDKLSDNGITVNSAYGKRIFHDVNKYEKTQYDYCYEMLVKDKNTRKAVITIYNYEDSYESKDNPCTLSLIFNIRNNKLNMYTFMRSNDVWLGLPYDLAFFTLVQEMLYNRLIENYPGLRLGSYYHYANSLHVYKRNYSGIENVINNNERKKSKILRINEKTVADFEKVLQAEKLMRACFIVDENYCKHFLLDMLRGKYAE